MSLQRSIAKFLKDEGYTTKRIENFQDSGITWRPFRDSDDFTILMASAKRGGDGSALVGDGLHNWDQIKLSTFHEWLSFYATSQTLRYRLPGQIEKSVLAVMMGSHTRLGQASPLSKLPADVLKVIAEMHFQCVITRDEQA